MAELIQNPTAGTLSFDAVADAMAVAGNVPGGLAVNWFHGDDLCDCIIQRIGWWTNPYSGETLLTRWCCIWAELEKQFPQFVQHVHAYNDADSGAWVAEPKAWDGDTPMPRALWYRQLSHKLGKPLAAIRAMYQGDRPPDAVR